MHAALTPTSLGAAAGAATAPRPAARRAAGPVGPAPRGPAAVAPAAPLRRMRRRSTGAAAAEPKAAPKADAGPGKLITSTEIPAFIPRTDLIQQLYRWVCIEADDAKVKYGAPLRVIPFTTKEGIPWGFNVEILRDGAPTATLSVGFDLTDSQKHEYVARGEDGFPVLQGKVEQVQGKFFEVRKTCDLTIDEDTRAVIRAFCTKLVQALNKYYAFGSCFVDDAT